MLLLLVEVFWFQLCKLGRGDPIGSEQLTAGGSLACYSLLGVSFKSWKHHSCAYGSILASVMRHVL